MAERGTGTRRPPPAADCGAQMDAQARRRWRVRRHAYEEYVRLHRLHQGLAADDPAMPAARRAAVAAEAHWRAMYAERAPDPPREAAGEP
jgi:hypothetical protein